MSQKVYTVDEIEEKLQSKPVHELRQIARAVGVKLDLNPKRETILKAILEIASNEVEPIKSARRGAKPKSDLVDRQIVADIELCRRVSAGLNDESVSDVYFEIEKIVDEGTGVECSIHGITYINDNHFYIHRFGYGTHSDAIINNSVAEKFKLQPFYSVKGKGIISVPNVFAVTQIEEINRSDARERGHIVERDFATAEGEGIKSILRIGELNQPFSNIVDFISPVFEGGSTLLLTSPMSERFKYIKYLSKSISKRYFRPILLLVDAYEGEADEISKQLPGCEVFCILATSSVEQKLNEIEMVLNYAKNLASLSNRVVLLTDGLSQIIHMGMDGKNTAQTARELFTLSKRTEDSSLSVIAAMQNDDYFVGKGYVSQFSMLADTIIKLSDKLEMQNIDPAIDLQSSFVKNKDFILSDHQSAIKNVKLGLGETGVLGLKKLVESGSDIEALVKIFKD